MSESIFDNDQMMNDSLSQELPLSLGGDISDACSLDDDDFSILGGDINELTVKIDNIAAKDYLEEDDCIILGAKMCPTRHGCTGATNCNYDYASYPG